MGNSTKENFARGACRWGQNCRFLHDRKSAQICRYFQNGFCGYGDQAGVTENVPDTRHPPDWALSSEFVPRQAQQDSGEGVWDRRRVGFADGLSKQCFPTHPTMLSNLAEMRRAGKLASIGGFCLSSSLLDRLCMELGCSPGASAVHATCCCGSLQAAGELGAGAAAGVEMKSKDVVCGICMDKVYEKALPQERLFGILPNCSHAYCVGCISKWRKSRDFQNAVIKACPECRVMSSYFIPHKYWVSDMNEKEKLIETFKARTGKIRCKFFVRGRGHCPFKSECIYLHELPRGQCPATRPPRCLCLYMATFFFNSCNLQIFLNNKMSFKKISPLPANFCRGRRKDGSKDLS
uniref:RING-type E3 ubiquitin transferase n=1 Tax=Crocodylus porosus TaxID=8502 RepID=A0A7M4FA48_CROPO